MPSSLRLSTAIRLGATLAPQAFHLLIDIQGKTCALGAASQAIGLDPKILLANDDYDLLIETFPILKWNQRSDGYLQTLAAVTFRNDSLKISREEIADWVQEQEKTYYQNHPDPENWEGKSVTETTQTLGLQSSKEEVTFITGETVNDRN